MSAADRAYNDVVVPFDLLKVERDRTRQLGIKCPVERVRDVGGGDAVAILEARILTNRERVDEAVLRDLPGLGDVWKGLAGGAQPGKAAEDVRGKPDRGVCEDERRVEGIRGRLGDRDSKSLGRGNSGGTRWRSPRTRGADEKEDTNKQRGNSPQSSAQNSDGHLGLLAPTERLQQAIQPIQFSASVDEYTTCP